LYISPECQQPLTAMGCCTSAASPRPAPVQRRRSSASGAEGGDAGVEAGEAEEDQGLISLLDARTVVELLETGGVGDRRMSIGSSTDQSSEPFSLKPTTGAGEKLDPAAAGIGYTCRRGLKAKPEAPNQDSFFVLHVEGDRPCSIYAVFDGHGEKGHDVSNFVKENLPKLIVKDPRFMTDQMDKMLIDCFKKMQGLLSSADRMNKISAQMSGTTCTIAIHDVQKNKLFLAHVADSSAVLCKRAGRRTIPLTRDHKPIVRDERKRIESSGGRVAFDGHANLRVYAKNASYPGLAISRCLGDLMGHNDCGLSCEPEVVVRELSTEDGTLLICSDGVWEFISPDEAVGIVSTYKPDQAMEAAEKLAKEAWDRWIQKEGGSVVDDITVIFVHLKQEQTHRPPDLRVFDI